MRPLVAPAVCAILVVAGCGDDSTAEPAPPTTTTLPSSTTSTTSTTAPSPSSSAPAPLPVPDIVWGQTRTLGQAGISDDGIGALDETLTEIGSDCFVIVQDGELVHERYWNDTDADTDTAVFSTMKSVAAIIVGIAQDLGHLDIDQPASDFITEWVGTDSEPVTIRQLLQNTSGRYYEFGQDDITMLTADDRSGFAIALPQVRPPGTEWFYNNSGVQSLEEVVERATGRDPGAFAEEHLFRPLGMEVVMGRDAAGNVGFFSGLEAGCLDIARFMLMISRGGDWGGRQIVSAEFAAEALTPATEFNQSYGFLFWLNADPPWDDAEYFWYRTDRFWPDAPLDAYMASGAADQVSMVFPSDDTIFVRLGPSDGSSGYDGVVANDLAGLMVTALEG